MQYYCECDPHGGNVKCDRPCLMSSQERAVAAAEIVVAAREKRIAAESSCTACRVAQADIVWLQAERQRLAQELGKAHQDILPWIEQVGWLTNELDRCWAALKQASEGLRDVGALHAADGIDAMLEDNKLWMKVITLQRTKQT